MKGLPKPWPKPLDVVQSFESHYHNNEGRAKVSYSAEMIKHLAGHFGYSRYQFHIKTEESVIVHPSFHEITDGQVDEWIEQFNQRASLQNVPIEAFNKGRMKSSMDGFECDGAGLEVLFRFTKTVQSSKHEARP